MYNRESVPSKLVGVVDTLQNVAMEEGIPEPWEYDIKIFDDGTYVVSLIHLSDTIADDIFGVGLRYMWNDTVIEKGYIKDKENPIVVNRTPVYEYDAPIDVIDSLQERHVMDE